METLQGFREVTMQTNAETLWFLCLYLMLFLGMVTGFGKKYGPPCLVPYGPWNLKGISAHLAALSLGVFGAYMEVGLSQIFVQGSFTLVFLWSGGIVLAYAPMKAYESSRRSQTGIC